MIAEVGIGGVFLAPIVIYAIAATAIFVACRFVLGVTGLLQRVWHPALFEVALFLAILSLLVKWF
jgi:protein AaeX